MSIFHMISENRSTGWMFGMQLACGRDSLSGNYSLTLLFPRTWTTNLKYSSMQKLPVIKLEVHLFFWLFLIEAMCWYLDWHNNGNTATHGIIYNSMQSLPKVLRRLFIPSLDIPAPTWRHQVAWLHLLHCCIAWKMCCIYWFCCYQPLDLGSFSSHIENRFMHAQIKM